MGHFDEDVLLERFYKWDYQDKRQRFLRRMEHKLRAKERVSARKRH